MSTNVIAVAADHAGYDLKVAIVATLRELGHIALDLGTNGHSSVDYPDFADALADHLRTGKATRGVLICGGGIGISIAANRHRHIRAALCHDGLSARLARQHNDANVIVFGGRLIAADVAKECLTVFLTAAFEGGRHARRVAKLTNGRHCEREGLLRRHDGPDPRVTQTAGQAPVGHTDTRPAPGSKDTELSVLMELEVGHERRKFTREFKLEAVRLIQGSRRVLCAETVPRQDLPDR